MEIIFIRHAEKKEKNGDVGLSKKGIKQARNLTKKLKKECFNEVYCSNLKRAIETANIISKKLSIPLKIDPALNEVSSSLLKKDRKKWTKKERKEYNKLKNFLDKLTKNPRKNKRILIISHGNAIRLCISILLELNPKNLIRLRLSDTGISEVYWMEKFKNWRLKYWNSTCHQPKELIEGKNKY